MPAAVSVTSLNVENGSYGIGDGTKFHNTFNEPVNVTGTPLLALETGENDGSAFYIAGSGTDVLTFSWTITEGHASADLDYVSTEALTLNGGTINNSVGNAAILILPNPGDAGSLSANKDIVIDAIRPSNAQNFTASSSSVS